MIVIGNKSYEVVVDYKNGWNMEVFRDRYSEVLERYDYIVGDWGYNQLRLKGFYKDNHPKASRDSSFSTLSDYINEYCNFGCAYFVLYKSKEIKDPNELKELKEAQELLEAAQAASKEEEMAQSESDGESGSDTAEEEIKPSVKNHQGSYDRNSAEPRNKRDSRENREPREHKSGKPSKWKDSKSRENRERRESRPAAKQRSQNDGT
ncbi:YutD family protein [Paenibacillus lemnae]|uniref:YutD family protein n=1 Tax=Paenibacillus lemnae TaxID=1330551 RepID=A0A848M4R1_PAELE|nr:YutD family protein [Paenibacillus lemnae]NMO95596.1 YutD family protein [Paenibacillus lemnae]